MKYIKLTPEEHPAGTRVIADLGAGTPDYALVEREIQEWSRLFVKIGDRWLVPEAAHVLEILPSKAERSNP